MDKIAIISDIHGNMTALQSVLTDIECRSISRIICLGDIIGKGPQPAQAVDLVREKCELIIRGNWEEGLKLDTDYEGLIWAREQLGPDMVDYLLNLPLSTEFLISGRLVRLFHASAKDINHRVTPWSSLEEREAMFANTSLTGSNCTDREPDVVGYADIHQPFVENIHGKTLFNTGSVGNAADLIPQASYAIIEGVFGSEDLKPFSLNLVRVPYNNEETIQNAIESGMPELEAFIGEVRTGRYRGA